ncbi:MAG: ATP-dependent helicase HrpB [Kiritimatiellia bacterium]|jgi:ATP-dependent helicase HrpB|nr:ATP-dependent helicase HrpB [Kiritimatiellia bacterium]
MKRLPIYDEENRIVDALRTGNRLIVVAPTGSGKSTQVPQMILRQGIEGDGRIVVLQPRRIAARMLARRVAGELEVQLGEEVGYQVRFENHSGPSTLIKYETDGILLREMLGDPDLRRVSVIVFDEFHERHLYCDLMLGFALRLQATTRPDLKIVIMSATLDAAQLESSLSPCHSIRSEGRAYPVDIRYLRSEARAKAEPWDTAVREVGGLLKERDDGDILVFMPGVYEIRRTVEALKRSPMIRECHVLPLYGELPVEEQDRALMPSSGRKIVVATNVAETSLTIEGITMVVDSGLARKASFDARRGINTLLVEKISQASADQRAGRAGRLSPGCCVRLWTERDQAGRVRHDPPELHRVDLAETVLQLRVAGVDDLAAFPWVDAPLPHSIDKAERLLYDLGALTKDGEVTELGRRLASFPLHPRVSRMLVSGEYFACAPTVCVVAALLQERPILIRRVDAQTRERRLDLVQGLHDSDLFLQLRAWEEASRNRFRREDCEPFGIHGLAARAVGRSAEQLLRTARSLGLDCFDADVVPELLYRCVMTGFPDQVARRVGSGSSRCSIVHGRRGTISGDSIVDSKRELVVAAEIQEIGKRRGEVDVRLSGLTALQPEWLQEMFGHAFSEAREIIYDSSIKRVRAERRTLYRDLVIAVCRAEDVTDDEAATLLADEVISGRLALKAWDAKVERWIGRVNLVADHCAELGVPGIRDTGRRSLVEQICHGARSYKDIKTREVWPVLKAWLSREQSASVEAYAPDRVRIENGREPRILYDDPANGPYMAIRIQDLYDTHALPFICMGKVPVRAHILAPNQRTVQITDDLESFWQNGYERAKKDLRGRYPKHEWR